MCALSATLRSKPKWWTKYTDPEIRARWKQEAVSATPPFGDIPLKEEEVEYVLDELFHFAALRDINTGIEASVSAMESLSKVHIVYAPYPLGIHLPPHLAVRFTCPR